MDDLKIPWPERGPFLTQLFVARQLVDSALDASFIGLAPPEGARVVLYNETDAGLGDVAFITKLCRLIRAQMPTVEVLLVSSDEGKQAHFGLPEGVRLVGEAAFLASASARDRQPTLVVSAPGIFDHCRQRELAYARLGISPEVPFQYIAEYGSLRQLRDDAFKGMLPALETLGEAWMDRLADAHGLSPDDMGYSQKSGQVVVVIDDEMRPLGHLLDAYVQRGTDNPMAEWLHQPRLEARSCGLELGELGIHVDASVPLMRPDPGALAHLEEPGIRSLVLDGQGVEGRALYVGYAYEGLAIFVDYVSLLEAEASRPIDVVVPHRDSAENLAKTIFDAAALGRLEARGVGHIEVIDQVDGGVVIPVGEGKRLRLITAYPIPNADFRRLQEASEPATMVSGDQSFSEAVSMGKAVLYLEPVYCQTYHLDAVLDLAERVAPALREVLSFGMQYRWDDERYPAVRDHLRSGALYSACEALNRTIQRDHDGGPALIGLLCRALWTLRSPRVAELSRQVLEAAWSSAHPDHGITLLGGDLGRLGRVVKEES